MEIPLPASVYEEGMPTLVNLLGYANGANEIILDFSQVYRYPPGAVACLATKVIKWRSEGKTVQFKNYQNCRAFRYLQRIDLFSNCGMDLPENFVRHPPGKRFVPLLKIGTGGRVDAPELSTEIAECMAPGLADHYDPDEYGFFDCIEYSVSEMVRNVFQHSKGTGFVCAQYYPQTDLTRIAIADTGIGILDSFKQSASPHCVPEMDDHTAIHLALKPEVSSKTHLGGMWGEVENAGVGLSLLNDLAGRLGGYFAVISGKAYYSLEESYVLPAGHEYKGTFCALTLKRSNIANFVNLLHQSKIDLGLVEPTPGFERMFQ